MMGCARRPMVASVWQGEALSGPPSVCGCRAAERRWQAGKGGRSTGVRSKSPRGAIDPLDSERHGRPGRGYPALVGPRACSCRIQRFAMKSLFWRSSTVQMLCQQDRPTRSHNEWSFVPPRSRCGLARVTGGDERGRRQDHVSAKSRRAGLGDMLVGVPWPPQAARSVDFGADRSGNRPEPADDGTRRGAVACAIAPREDQPLLGVVTSPSSRAGAA